MSERKMQKAAALRYEPNQGAPQVIAKGRGLVAEKIIENAKEHDIPIYEEPQLVEILNELEIGEQIPPALYEVVAEILTFVSSIDALLDKKK